MSASNWFIYTDDFDAEWAMQLPRAVGQHPAMGYVPLGSRRLPELRIRYTYVGPLRPRHVRLQPLGPVGPVSRTRTYPVGTRAAFVALDRHLITVNLPVRDQPTEWTVVGAFGESMTVSRYQKARASFT